MFLRNPHVIAFLQGPDTGPDNSLAGYARAFFASDRDRGLDAEAIKGLDEVGAATLSFVDRNAGLRALPPDAVDRLMTQERCLLRSIAEEWHMPPGERLIKSWVEVLAEDFRRCPAGAVVVVRQTDRAVVAYVFPHIRVDTATGAVLRDPLPPLVPRSHAADGDELVHPMAVGDDDAGQLALSTAAELAFALPEPWGVLISAGLHFIDALLPKHKVDVAKQIVDALENFIKQRDLNTWAQEAQGLMTWCNEQISQMSQQDPPPTQVGRLLDDLERNLAPGGSSLYDHLMRIANEAYIHEKDAFEILLVCVSSYLFAMKFKLVLDAYVAHTAFVGNDMKTFNEWNSTWRYDYIGFRDAILGTTPVQGWTPKVEQIITNFVTQRLAKVTAVQRQTISKGETQQDGSILWQSTSGWTFGDTQNGGDDWENHFFADSGDDKDPVEHRDQAEQAHDAYLRQLSATLDQTYDAGRKTAQKWQDSINEWNEHLPPDQPKAQPKIDPNGWQGKAVPHSDWAKHKQVSYAVQFYNDKGPGLLSDWTKPVDINGRAAPTLTDVPLDTLLMATGRRIYRRFDAEKESLLALIADNTTTTWVDNQ